MKYNVQILLLIVCSCFVVSVSAQSRSLKKGKVQISNFDEEIPFEFIKNKIIIPVQINDKTYRFLVDTGAPNIVSKEVSEVLNSRNTASLSANDANEISQKLDIVTIDKINIGNVTFESFSALVFDLNGSDVFKCFNIDGFIGSNLLKKTILQIDANKRVLRISNDIKNFNLNKKESSKIKLVGNQSSPYVWIKLKGEDKGKEMVLIDTGMGGLYDLSADNYNTFKKSNIFNAIGTSDGASSVSLFGEVPINSQTRVHLPLLTINDFKINDIITHTTKGDNSRIGAELLNYGVMTIDYKNKRFYFNSYEESIDLKGDFGFTQTLKDNKLVIGYVWDEDLKNKMTYGDEILELNGEVLSANNLCDYIAKKSVLKNADSVTIKFKSLSDDNIKELTLYKKPLTKIFEELKTN